MYEHKKIQTLWDFFLPLESRKEKGVYFYRISRCNAQIEEFLRKYYETARRFGVIIEGKIPNPDEKNLAYYNEIMGNAFQRNTDFILCSLKKWLPRMSETQRRDVGASMYETLCNMQRDGKNENMQKNAYIKFMCWLYYRFEQITGLLGGRDIPKLLYEGEISKYELMMLSILSGAGCDIVLLTYQGDGAYRKLDPSLSLSDELLLPGTSPFAAGFSLKSLRTELKEKQDRQRLYGEPPSVQNCTNAWIKGEGLSDIKEPPEARGQDPKLFYNCFVRISGVQDKLTCLNELYQFWITLKNSGRKPVIIENEILAPTPEEIGAIRRKQYTGAEQMLADLSINLSFAANPNLARLMKKAFLDVLLDVAKMPGMNVNKLTNKAVYLLCWLKRYQADLFRNWKMPGIACLIYLNGCKNETEALFLKCLARLPVDVLLLAPDQSEPYRIKDSLLYEIHFDETLAIGRFPTEQAQVHVGTAAYHAEQELNTLLYQDSGMYRPKQYARANAVILSTTYEEIAILWDQELKYRPNFSTIDGIVNVPVLCAKVSGVKEGAAARYWEEIKKLITKDTFVIKSAPYLMPTDENRMKPYAAEFFKNGKLQKEKIKSHKYYPYGFLREEMQEHILEKLSLLISLRTIRGTFENGTEYTVISTVLNLNKEITRLLQKYDFTKQNPKLIYIHTTERAASLEDAILMAFLNLAGFDVLLFVPTGYQGIERYLNQKIMEEHQIGEYVYDLAVPDFNKVSSGTRPSWREKIFKRGN